MSLSKITTFNAPGARAPVGHYSHVAAAGGLAFAAVHLPSDGCAQGDALPCVGAQLDSALDGLEASLASAGATLGTVLRTTIYLVDIADWAEANRAYGARFGAHRPARGVICVAALRHGWSVAIDAVAAIGRTGG